MTSPSSVPLLFTRILFQVALHFDVMLAQKTIWYGVDLQAL